MIRVLLLPFILLSVMQSTRAGELQPITVLCVGDSTVQSYPEDGTLRGWGQMLPRYFQPEARVENAAVGGSSSKSFYEQGFWKKALALHPTYVLIQFGHNDRAKDDRGTDPQTTYRECIRRYVRETREAGAIPILVGSMSPRAFSLKDGILRSNVAPYAAAMRTVAEEEKIPFIDLHTPTFEHFKKLGAEQSRRYAPREGDINHFNADGADLLARIVADGLSAQVPALHPYLKNSGTHLAIELE